MSQPKAPAEEETPRAPEGIIRIEIDGGLWAEMGDDPPWALMEAVAGAAEPTADSMRSIRASVIAMVSRWNFRAVMPGAEGDVTWEVGDIVPATIAGSNCVGTKKILALAGEYAKAFSALPNEPGSN